MVNAPIIVSLTPTPSSHLSQDSGSSDGVETIPTQVQEVEAVAVATTGVAVAVTSSSTTNGLNVASVASVIACGKSTIEQGTQTDNNDEDDEDDDDEEEDDDEEYDDNNDEGEGEGVTGTANYENGFHDCDYVVNEVVHELEEEFVAEIQEIAHPDHSEQQIINLNNNIDDNNVLNDDDNEKICDSSEFCYSIPNENNKEISDNLVKSEEKVKEEEIDDDEDEEDDEDNESIKSVVDVVKSNLKVLDNQPQLPPPPLPLPTNNTNTNITKMTSNTYTTFTPQQTTPSHYTVAHTQPNSASIPPVQPLILGFAPVQPSRLHHHCPQHNPLPPNTQLQFISLTPQPGVPVSQPQNQTTSVAAVQSSTAAAAGSWPFIEAPLFQIDANGEPRPFCPAHPHGPTVPHDQRYVLHLDGVPAIQISPAAGGIQQAPPPQPQQPQHSQPHGGGKRKHHGFRGGESIYFFCLFTI